MNYCEARVAKGGGESKVPKHTRALKEREKKKKKKKRAFSGERARC